MIRSRNHPTKSAFRFAAARRLRGFLADRSGGALLWFGLSVPVMLGAAGIGVDVTLWYMDRRILQTASDTSAIAGAHVLAQGASEAEVTQVVKDEIARNDFTAHASDDITVNIPPESGPNAGSAGFVEVIITKQRTNYLTRILGQDTTDIRARAVSGGGGSGEHCVLSLDKSADGAVNFTGTAVTDINCGVAANSRSESAIDLDGGATVEVDYIEAHGDISVSNNASLTSDYPPKPYSDWVNDPYATLEIPEEPAACYDGTGADPGLVFDAGAGVWTVNGGVVTLNPERYCGGLFISAGANVTFNSGLYILDGGDFRVNAGSTLSGTELTFILTADAAADVGVIWFNGQSEAVLSASTEETDPYAGVLYYVDRREATELVKVKGKWTEQPIVKKSKFLGGADMNLIGAVYTPSQHVQWTGGSTSGDGCTILIANTVDFAGNTSILNSEVACTDYRVQKISTSRIALQE